MTFVWWKVADGPREVAACVPVTGFRSRRWMIQVPWAERARATARPMPEAPPVMIATFLVIVEG